jgi:tetratricopeptide (TPR) repeat protein
VTGYLRLRRRQILQEAEGYLELVLAFADQWPLDSAVRRQVICRALHTLDQLDETQCVEGLMLRGQALRLLEDYPQAVEAFQKAVEKDRENIHALLELGWCYKRIGRVDLAIRALEDALEVDREQAIIYYNLACYWSLAKNVALTLAYLAQAFELDETYRELVAEESDFDPVRNHPEFLALTSVIV